MQNAADAIALAAAQELPDENAAEDAALEWAERNDIEAGWVDLTFTQQSPPAEPNPKVRVEVTRVHSFTFARLIGIESTPVSAAAASIRTSPAGGDGVVPLSVLESAVTGIPWASTVTLKYDVRNITTGNTGPIRIDGPGSGNCTSSDSYCLGVMQGAENVVCAASSDDTYCNGPSVVDTEPGHMVGGTRNAINYRMDNTDSHCDTFDEVFTDDPTTSDQGAYRFEPLCNPFIAGSYASQRVVIIPVVDRLCNGSCEVTIVEFALFFIESMGSGACGPTPPPTPCGNRNGRGAPCTGNDCEVIGRFVQVGQNVGLLAGTYNPNASTKFIRLVE